jgi:hypothetical protein
MRRLRDICALFMALHLSSSLIAALTILQGTAPVGSMLVQRAAHVNTMLCTMCPQHGLSSTSRSRTGMTTLLDECSRVAFVLEVVTGVPSTEARRSHGRSQRDALTNIS